MRPFFETISIALAFFAVVVLVWIIFYTPPAPGAVPTEPLAVPAGECWAPYVDGERVTAVRPYSRRGDCIRIAYASIANTCEKYDEPETRALCYEKAPATVRCAPSPCAESL